jgi:hypothetical protein
MSSVLQRWLSSPKTASVVVAPDRLTFSTPDNSRTLGKGESPLSGLPSFRYTFVRLGALFIVPM